MKRKKQAIKLIEITKKENNLSFLESRYNSTSKCQVIWEEWSLFLKSNDPKYLIFGTNKAVRSLVPKRVEFLNTLHNPQIVHPHILLL